MPEFAARIRSFKPKNTDTNIVVFPTPLPDDGGDENWRGKMIENAKSIADMEGNLDGFLVLGLWDNGQRSLGFRFSSRVAREMLPAYIAEIVRTDIVTAWEAETTFDDKFEWVES